MASDASSSAKRRVIIVLFMIGLLLGGLAVAAFLAEEQDEIPFEYDGFD